MFWVWAVCLMNDTIWVRVWGAWLLSVFGMGASFHERHDLSSGVRCVTAMRVVFGMGASFHERHKNSLGVKECDCYGCWVWAPRFINDTKTVSVWRSVTAIGVWYARLVSWTTRKQFECEGVWLLSVLGMGASFHERHEKEGKMTCIFFSVSVWVLGLGFCQKHQIKEMKKHNSDFYWFY